MSKKMKLNEVRMISSVKELLNLAAEEDGEEIAFQYKDENDKIVEITYKQFLKDTEELGTAIAKT